MISNDLISPAEELMALYKQRWQIELFFKWIIQNLKIKCFFGTTEQAVDIPVAVMVTRTSFNPADTQSAKHNVTGIHLADGTLET